MTEVVESKPKAKSKAKPKATPVADATAPTQRELPEPGSAARKACVLRGEIKE